MATSAVSGSTRPLLSLLDETWETVALYLEAPDLLSLQQVNSDVHTNLRDNVTLWKAMLHREERMSPSAVTESVLESVHTVRRRFLQACYRRMLPDVRWQALRQDGGLNLLGREAHLACVLHDGNLLVCTQGYSQDTTVWCRDLTRRRWYACRPPPNPALHWAYGCTLTSLTRTSAVRVGGFRSGGYSNETAQVAVLHVETNPDDPNTPYRVRWEVPMVQTQGGGMNLARAYASAVCLGDGYLLVVGGISRGTSTMAPVVLNTRTWTWLDAMVLSTTELYGEIPSGRHGCSLIWDAPRQRVLMFGGASGRDILRSGEDLSDIWQMAPRQVTSESFDVFTLPWVWTQLHANPWKTYLAEDEREEEVDDPMGAAPLPDRLSPSEALTLGRCHAAHHVHRDTVLLVFGSCRPSTNGIIAYNLRTDTFFRPRVQGCLPAPRFTFASAYLPNQAAIWVHSGWSTQTSSSLEPLTPTSMALLELTPMLGGAESAAAAGFTKNVHAQASGLVTDEHVHEARRVGDPPDRAAVQQLLMSLMEEENPRESAARLLQGDEWDEQQAILLQMVASGQLTLGGGESDEEDDEDDYDDDDSEDEDIID